MAYNAQVHHRRSIRLRGYGYARAGAYFVTICTHERTMLFVDLSMRGIAEEAWRLIMDSDDRPIDEFVVMPNHVHGIIWIASPNRVGAQQRRHRFPAFPMTGDARAVSGQRADFVAAPLRTPDAGTQQVIPGSLGALLRAFKAATAKRINNLRKTPGAPVWQRNYYEHVVRGEADLARIREYIRDNPLKWADDPDNPANHRGQT